LVKLNYTVLDLFPMPLYKSTLPVLDPITIQKLKSHEWEHVDGFVTHTETSNRHLLDKPEYKGLKAVIQKHVDTFVYDVIGVQKDHIWEITTSWVNRSVPGQYHVSHWHSNSLVSGVIYINTNPNSGAILFHKERAHKNLWGDTLRFEFDKETDYNTEAVGILPKTNEILLFPSILNHSVLENTSNEERYSLAFNVFPRGVFGANGNSELSV
jgi:uncharacterized protein (TIGR02466 family)